jgi:glycerophosphoryl diester phosphodiesterase
MKAGVIITVALTAVTTGVEPVAAFDLQGHRGARGLVAENTLAGFAEALQIGVTTLESDLGVTKDGVLVHAHDRVLNPDIVRGPDGSWLSAPTAAINALTLAELKRFDVGRLNPSSKYAQQFSGQRAVDGERIPTFAEVADLVAKSGKPVRFNLETKLSPDKPDETVDADTFARLVVEAVRAAGLALRVTIQSFDWRTLLAAKKLAPEIETVCLTYKTTLEDRVEAGSRRPSAWLAGLDPRDFGGSIPRLVAATGCGTWSPYFRELDAAAVAEAHAAGLKVVPWTINDSADMARIIDMKVDGLITDYPDRARKVMADKGLSLP